MAFFDRVRFGVSGTPGTGAITVGTAMSGFTTPAGAQPSAIPNATALQLLAEDGAAWEIFDSVYTSAGTSCSRGTLRASSSGSRLTLTSAAVISVIASARQILDKTTDATIDGTLTLTGGGTLTPNGGNIYSSANFGHSTGAVIGSGGLQLANSSTLAWSFDGTWFGTKDVLLARSATATLGLTGSFTATGTLASGANSGTLGALKLFGSTSGDVTVKAAAAAGTATVFQLPATNGTNTYVLQTNGSGVTSWVPAGSGLTVGSSAIASGSATNILYNNAGVLGEYTITGTGTVVAMQTSPAFTTPSLGAATGTTLGLSNTLTVTQGTANTAVLASTGYSLTGSATQAMIDLAGTWNTSGVCQGIKLNITNTSSPALAQLLTLQYGGGTILGVGNQSASGATTAIWLGSGVGITPTNANFALSQTANSTLTLNAQSGGTMQFNIGNTKYVSVTTARMVVAAAHQIGWSSTSDPTAAPDVILTRSAAAVLQHGAANAASPVAQTVQAQGSRSGTDSNVSGANLTIQSGNGTGNSAVSSLILASPVAVASGTGAQTLTIGLTIKGGQAVASTYTVSTLPTGIAGGLAYVTDGDASLAWGATVINSGAGATKYLVWFNNGNWTVAGK